MKVKVIIHGEFILNMTPSFYPLGYDTPGGMFEWEQNNFKENKELYLKLFADKFTMKMEEI